MEKSKRNTQQKQIILDALAVLKFNHPTALDVLNQIRKSHPAMSKATVYRNLKSMAEEGIIVRMESESGLERYDCNTHSHAHFKCNKCGELYDLDEDLGATIKYKCAFVVKSIDVVLRGNCDKCK